MRPHWKTAPAPERAKIENCISEGEHYAAVLQARNLGLSFPPSDVSQQATKKFAELLASNPSRGALFGLDSANARAIERRALELATALVTWARDTSAEDGAEARAAEAERIRLQKREEFVAIRARELREQAERDAIAKSVDAAEREFDGLHPSHIKPAPVAPRKLRAS